MSFVSDYEPSTWRQRAKSAVLAILWMSIGAALLVMLMLAEPHPRKIDADATEQRGGARP